MSGLPSGYTQLEYIQSSGTQYINTAFKPKSTSRVVMDFEFIENAVASPFMSRDISNDTNMFGVFNINGRLRSDFNTTKVSFPAGLSPLQKLLYDRNKNVCTIGSETITNANGTFSAPRPLFLFASNDSGSAAYFSTGKLYSCAIYDNGTLVRDFITAKDEVGNAGLYDKVEGKFYYNVGTGSFGIPGVRTIDSVSVGQSVYCNVNNTKTEFIIVHQGKPSSMYDDSCNGTWLLMKNIYENRQWNSSNGNNYKASTIHSYLNSTFLNLLDIKDIIRQAKIPYVDGTGGSAVASGANGLSCKVFLMSGYEVGWTTSDDQHFPVDGAKLDYFTASSGGNSKRIATYSGSDASWWLRSPVTDGTNFVWDVASNGGYSNDLAAASCGIRPALILPFNTLIDSSGNIVLE